MSARSHSKKAGAWELSVAISSGTWKAFVTKKMECKVISCGEFKTEQEAIAAATQGFVDHKVDDVIDEAYVQSPLNECMYFITTKDIEDLS
jgi:hypothetical protein